MTKRALLRTLSDVDIRLLRIFAVVAECDGIAASELELNISKSTISRHISDLEHRIGFKTCHRGPAGFSLTPEGEKLLRYTEQLLAQIDNFQTQIDGIQKNLTGTLRLGILDQSFTNPRAKIHDAIATFDEIAPDVGIDILLDAPSPLEASVSNGSLDLAIVPLYQPSSALRYTKLYSEHMSLYCGKGHPLFGVDTEALTPSPDLEKYKYAGFGFNSPNMRAGNNLGVSRSAQVSDEEALVLLVQSGKYLCYLADHVARGLGGRDSVWPILPRKTSYSIEFAAIVRRRPEPDRKAMAFLQCLIEAHRTTKTGDGR